MNKQPSLNDIKEAIRNKYAWPGGYPLYLICADGEALSIDSARDNWHRIARACIVQDRNDPWRVIGVNINYENPDLYCVASGKRIESAYADDESLVYYL